MLKITWHLKNVSLVVGSSKYDRDFLGGLEKPHPEKLFEERKFLGTAVPLPRGVPHARQSFGVTCGAKLFEIHVGVAVGQL